MARVHFINLAVMTLMVFACLVLTADAKNIADKILGHNFSDDPHHHVVHHADGNADCSSSELNGGICEARDNEKVSMLLQ